jgi:hypothetical protein
VFYRQALPTRRHERRSRKTKENKRKPKKIKESSLFFGIKPFQWITGGLHFLLTGCRPGRLMYRITSEYSWDEHAAR